MSPRVEALVRSDDFARMTAVIARSTRLAGNRVNAIAAGVWHLMNLPAGTDLQRLRMQVGALDREVRRLSLQLDRDSASRIQESFDRAALPATTSGIATASFMTWSCWRTSSTALGPTWVLLACWTNWAFQRPDTAKNRAMTILDRFRIDDRVAIVTGASSGLGVAFAVALAEAGADVSLGARRDDRLEATRKLVEDAGRRAITVRTDVASPDDCRQLVDATMSAFGRVDILVNNAGIGTSVPATRETPEQFRSVIDVNLNGCYWMAQACARVMQPGSSIINIASVLGLTSAGIPQAAYSASKAGLIGLTRDLAQQWTGRKGIRVNALAPGYFESEMTGQFPDDYIERTVLPRTLEGRLGHAAELSAALIFLASDASSYVTGITLPVDGGILTT